VSNITVTCSLGIVTARAFLTVSVYIASVFEMTVYLLTNIKRFQIGVVIADTELIAVYNLARKFLSHRLQYTAINITYAANVKTPYSYECDAFCMLQLKVRWTKSAYVTD